MGSPSCRVGNRVHDGGRRCQLHTERARCCSTTGRHHQAVGARSEGCETKNAPSRRWAIVGHGICARDQWLPHIPSQKTPAASGRQATQQRHQLGPAIRPGLREDLFQQVSCFLARNAQVFATPPRTCLSASWPTMTAGSWPGPCLLMEGKDDIGLRAEPRQRQLSSHFSHLGLWCWPAHVSS